MATPATLSTLESSDDRPLLHSCRYGEVFFDQLLLPQELRTYAGRPSVTVVELCDEHFKGDKHPMQAPLTREELRAALVGDSALNLRSTLSLFPLGPFVVRSCCAVCHDWNLPRGWC